MKTTLGVGISVLSALAAQGKDFDRAELNAMLDRLAASRIAGWNEEMRFRR